MELLCSAVGRDTSIKVASNCANSIPDLKFDIKEILFAGDRVIVLVGGLPLYIPDVLQERWTVTIRSSKGKW